MMISYEVTEVFKKNTIKNKHELKKEKCYTWLLLWKDYMGPAYSASDWIVFRGLSWSMTHDAPGVNMIH